MREEKGKRRKKRQKKSNTSREKVFTVIDLIWRPIHGESGRSTASWYYSYLQEDFRANNFAIKIARRARTRNSERNNNSQTRRRLWHNKYTQRNLTWKKRSNALWGRITSRDSWTSKNPRKRRSLTFVIVPFYCLTISNVSHVRQVHASKVPPTVD